MRSRTLLAVFATALGPASIAGFACNESTTDTSEAGASSSGGSSSGGQVSVEASVEGSPDVQVGPDSGCQAAPPPIAAAEDGGPVDAAGVPDATDSFGRYPNEYCQTVCAHAGAERQACQPDGDGGVTCFQWCFGRRPRGLAASSPSSSTFSEMERLEAASVPAFRMLARDLVRFGAPKKLVRAARRSARDETRHARAMRALACRRGEPRIPLALAPATRERSLEDIAIENAVEGCVRETWGALLAHHQSAHARETDVRAAMKRIARDETDHAALSWRILAWTTQRLDRTGRARVRTAMREAVAELASAAREMPSELGLPDADEQRRLVGELDRMLWS